MNERKNTYKATGLADFRIEESEIGFADNIVGGSHYTELTVTPWVVLQDPKYNGFSTCAMDKKYPDKNLNRADCKKLVKNFIDDVLYTIERSPDHNIDDYVFVQHNLNHAVRLWIFDRKFFNPDAVQEVTTTVGHSNPLDIHIDNVSANDAELSSDKSVIRPLMQLAIKNHKVKSGGKTFLSYYLYTHLRPRKKRGRNHTRSITKNKIIKEVTEHLRPYQYQEIVPLYLNFIGKSVDGYEKKLLESFEADGLNGGMTMEMCREVTNLIKHHNVPKHAFVSHTIKSVIEKSLPKYEKYTKHGNKPFLPTWVTKLPDESYMVCSFLENTKQVKAYSGYDNEYKRCMSWNSEKNTNGWKFDDSKFIFDVVASYDDLPEGVRKCMSMIDASGEDFVAGFGKRIDILNSWVLTEKIV
jgi:hypothetical protein|tara:strand:- start:3964 stop:5199 length:1236 start_codon:yes stop_codon:yes gene_type:complete